MPLNPKKPGKSLETLVSSIERVLSHNANVSVQSPVHLPDRGGTETVSGTVFSVRGGDLVHLFEEGGQVEVAPK